MGEKISRFQEINYERMNLFGSIFMGFIAIGLVVVTIVMIPIPIYSNGWIICQDNFFYRTIGAFIGIVWYMPKMFIISFIILIAFATTFGSTFRLKEFNNTRKVILVSLCSNVLPIIAAIISAIRLSTNEGLNIFSGWFNTWYLGFFPILVNLPIQLILLRRKESFGSWAGYSNKNGNILPIYLKQRKIASGLFLIVYIGNFSMVIIYAIYHYIIWRRPWIVLIPISLYLLWWVCGELIVKRWIHKKTAKKMIIEDIVNGITNIDLLAEKHLLAKERIREIINKAEEDQDIEKEHT